MAYTQRAEGLDQLRRDLALIPDEILTEGEKIVGKGMLNIKKDAQRRRRDQHIAHAPHVPRSYSYDVTRRGQVIRGEGGADIAKLQGGIDVYLEFGTPTSAAHPVWGPALDAELPNFYRYADDLLEQLVPE
jgi:hypothetical protein